jgi:hypothetical protein
MRLHVILDVIENERWSGYSDSSMHTAWPYPCCNSPYANPYCISSASRQRDAVHRVRGRQEKGWQNISPRTYTILGVDETRAKAERIGWSGWWCGTNAHSQKKTSKNRDYRVYCRLTNVPTHSSTRNHADWWGVEMRGIHREINYREPVLSTHQTIAPVF